MLYVKRYIFSGFFLFVTKLTRIVLNVHLRVSHIYTIYKVHWRIEGLF